MDVGRNERCPCGSGKKYKHCCLDKDRGGASPNASTSSGSCDAAEASGSRCGKPQSGRMWCKVCGRIFVYCHGHQGAIQVQMNGHVLRVHPETIPGDKFDELLGNESLMAELRSAADRSPELWKDFFDYVARRQRGEAPAPSEGAGIGIAERGLDYRAKALRERGQMVRWYDGAWSFLLSCGTEELAEVPMWIFSAQLYPPGRGSTESDWVDLGRWSHAVGVPRGQAEIGDTIRRSANAVHKWSWVDDKPQKASADN